MSARRRRVKGRFGPAFTVPAAGAGKDKKQEVSRSTTYTSRGATKSSGVGGPGRPNVTTGAGGEAKSDIPVSDALNLALRTLGTRLNDRCDEYHGKRVPLRRGIPPPLSRPRGAAFCGSAFTTAG